MSMNASKVKSLPVYKQPTSTFGIPTKTVTAPAQGDLQRGTTFGAPLASNELTRTRDAGDKARKDMLAEVMQEMKDYEQGAMSTAVIDRVEKVVHTSLA